MLLQAFYSIRSERLLMERLEYDLLFRWFVGIGVDDAAWDHSVSRRTAAGCWKATSRPSSWRRCWRSPM
jgi:transposase